MKKIIYSAMAVAMLATTSCKDDMILPGGAGETATVAFNVSTPEIGTRAYSDGTTATVLQYAVYEKNGDELTYLPNLTVAGENATSINGKTTVKLDLTTGETYAVIFWAAAPDAPYTVDFANKKMTVDYNGAVSNDESRDAFYKYETFTVTGADSKTVELKRPFAQLNIGTSDYAQAAKAGYTPTHSAVTVNDVYTVLNLATGDVDEATKISASFGMADIKKNEKFPVDGYEYLAMNYFLVDDEKETVEVKFAYGKSDDINEAKTRTVGSVPVQRNFRTNIYGKLLTSMVDINVTIDPIYECDALEAWNGSELIEPAYDATTKTYSVANGAQLAWISALVNGTLDTNNVTRTAVAANSLKDCTVKLVADINLNGKEWTPIGHGSNHFQGTLDGNGHTIYGLTVKERRDARAALVGTVSGTVAFRNLTFKGANIACPDFNGDFYGSALIGTAYGNVTIENVNVIDSYISGNNKVGALLAHDGVVSSLNINNCSVSNTTFEARNTKDGGSVGGLVGFFQGVAKGTQAAPYGNHVIANSTVKDCIFNVVNSTNSGKRANGQLIGGINSIEGQKLYINNYSVINNTWNEEFYVDGAKVTSDTYKSTLEDYIIGGERNDNPKGKVFINGKEVFLTPVEDYDAFLAKISDDTWYDNTKTELAIEDVADFAAFIETANSGNDFKGKTIKLTGDIDLYFKDVTKLADGDPITFRPIGDTQYGNEPFKGTFDGQGHTIKNLYQNGWDLGYNWDNYGSYGLFGKLEDATVKNVVIEGSESYIEGGDVSFIAGSAIGDCVFENIEIKSGVIATYNNGNGGIIGWSGAGNYTFKNITIGEDVVLGGLWGSFDSSIGGIVGQAEPGATYNFENVTINCRIDAYNDCTASYDYYNYRMCGMIIGRCNETTTIDGANYPDLSKYNMTFKNVVVNYGQWMNYHYCRRSGERAVRIEQGYAYGGAENRDHSGDNVHCMECIPFDQLIGGNQYDVKGLREVNGVTVNYPAAYTCPLCRETHGK